MTANLRQMTAVWERRKRVAELYLRGFSQAEIVKEMGLASGAGQKMVSIDIKEIQAGWKRQATQDFDELKGRQLGKLELAERELWAAWERSKRGRTTRKDKEVLRKKTKVHYGEGDEWKGGAQGEDHNTDSANDRDNDSALGSGSDASRGGSGDDALELIGKDREVTREARDGDPRFASLILHCIKDQNELMGVVARPGETSTAPPVVGFRLHRPPDDTPAPEVNPSNGTEGASTSTAQEGTAVDTRVMPAGDVRFAPVS